MDFTKGSKFRITIDDCDFTVVKRAVAERGQNALVLTSHGNRTWGDTAYKMDLSEALLTGDGSDLFDGSFIGNGTEGNNVVFIPLTPNIGSPGTYVCLVPRYDCN